MLATGLLLLPMSLVVGAGALASGPLTARFGSRPPMIAGFTLGAAPSLHVPLLVASFGYLIAVVLAWTTVRGASRRPASG